MSKITKYAGDVEVSKLGVLPLSCIIFSVVGFLIITALTYVIGWYL
jgi:hypothetical protein